MAMKSTATRKQGKQREAGLEKSEGLAQTLMQSAAA